MEFQGSTKDLKVSGNHLEFSFSDRFSVFDYGAFPYELAGKGEAQKKFAVAIDQELKKISNTAFLSYEPIQQIYFNRDEFIPLEFIFRLGVVEGSSYLKRHPEIKPFHRFSTPIVELTTKLEEKDRALSFKEAQDLTSHDISFLVQELIPQISINLGKLFQNKGLELWDGKFEFACRDKKYYLIDAVTQDELRFTCDKKECSKELVRKIFRITPWYEDGMKTFPPTINQKFQKILTGIYQSSAEIMAGSGNKSKLLEYLHEYEVNLCHAF